MTRVTGACRFFEAGRAGGGAYDARSGIGLSLRPLAGLAQDEEPGLRGGAAGGGRGLGALVPKRRHGIRERRHQCPSYGNHQNEDHRRFRRRRWNIGHDAP
jgi:hypothetical protein